MEKFSLSNIHFEEVIFRNLTIIVFQAFSFSSHRDSSYTSHALYLVSINYPIYCRLVSLGLDHSKWASTSVLPGRKR